MTHSEITIIKGDGIGIDVTEATLDVVGAACGVTGGFTLEYREILAGAKYFDNTSGDIESGGEEAAGKSDAMFLGAIGLPSIRHDDGTEISPHLRLRDRYGLYAGVRPVKAYANAPQRLADERAANIDMVILRESTEGLFYSAAVHGRSEVIGDQEVRARGYSPAWTRPTYSPRWHFSGEFSTKSNRSFQTWKPAITTSMLRRWISSGDPGISMCW